MTDHDFEYTLSRIGTIADSVDSSMTVGEIVRRAYLCGVGDTLDEFREARRQTDLRRNSAIDGAIAIDEIGAMVYRDGRIASMLTHPGSRPSGREVCLEFPSVAEAESR